MVTLFINVHEVVLVRKDGKMVQKQRDVQKQFYPGEDNLCDEFEWNHDSVTELMEQEFVRGKYILSFAGHRPVWTYCRVPPSELIVHVDEEN